VLCYTVQDIIQEQQGRAQERGREGGARERGKERKRALELLVVRQQGFGW
jgi:hypothetical protein